MKLMLIKGKVLGGHKIKDLGLLVPYEREVRIQLDRASWSSDLSFALNNGHVEKVRVIDSSREQKPQGLSGQKIKKPIYKNQVEKETKPETRKLPVSSSSNDVQQKDLMDKMESVMQGQQDLMAKISDLINKPSPDSGLSKEDLHAILSSISNTNTGAVPSRTDFQSDDSDDIYIPTKIRSSETKVSNKMEVEESTSNTSSVDNAAKALAAMKKANK